MENSRQWQEFSNYLDYLIDSQHRIMEQTDNLQQVHRAQGAVYQLRRLKLLRDEVLKTQ